jgi:hypothetical protein
LISLQTPQDLLPRKVLRHFCVLPVSSTCGQPVFGEKMDNESAASESARPVPTYWLTRYVILRLLGTIYAIAFLVAINQIVPLIGSDGLLPVGPYLNQISDAIGPTAGFFKLPSLFWFTHSDTALLIVAWLGFLLACIVVAGYANALMLFVLWFLYMSIVHVGPGVVFVWMGEFNFLKPGSSRYSFVRLLMYAHSGKGHHPCQSSFCFAGSSFVYAWCGIDQSSLGCKLA